MMPVFCLSIHADYACRHSGACCTSGWPIHVESQRLAVLQQAMGDGRLAFDRREAEAASPFESPGELPPDAGAVIRVGASGACAFYDRQGGLCAIHRSLGHEHLPAACQHFPRRCLIEEDRTAVSLSHYCPTVARLAFRSDVTPGVVPAPGSLAGHLALEGLDARGALPPLVRPDLLADTVGYRRWERVVLGILARPVAVDAALEAVSGFTEEVREWSPRDGSLAEAVDRIGPGWNDRLARAPETLAPPTEPSHLVAAYEDACAAVPTGLAAPPLPAGLGPIDAMFVAPAWPEYSRPLRHFLAAHTFGNWCAYHGMGLRTVAHSLRVALAVVRVEAARLCSDGRRPLDEAILLEAFRAADLLLVHLADPKALAAGLSEVESAE